MLDVILAISEDFGIGKDGGLPWRCKEELKIFREKTLNTTLIVGRETYRTLPLLRNRKLIVVSRKEKPYDDGDTSLINDIDPVLTEWSKSTNVAFVIGGAKIYNYVFNHHLSLIRYVHLSVMKTPAVVDTWVKLDLTCFTIVEHEEYDEFDHFVLSPGETGESAYLRLLNEVVSAPVKTGRNGQTRSVFGRTVSFSNEFPLLTTKKMFFRGIVEELLFFLRGDTNSKLLEEKGVNIWKENTSREFLDANGFPDRKEGMMGAMYGYQLRNFNAVYDELTGKPKSDGIDQLKYVIDTIRNDPDSRRIMMTCYNPLQASADQAGGGVLFPCHSIIVQFYCRGQHLDMSCYNRSQDLFHGLPFNIASSALLLKIVAKATGRISGTLTINMGDCHIYEQHLDAVKTQLRRIKYRSPEVELSADIQTVADVENLKFEDFCLTHYTSWPAIKAKMVA